MVRPLDVGVKVEAPPPEVSRPGRGGGGAGNSPRRAQFFPRSNFSPHFGHECPSHLPSITQLALILEVRQESFDFDLSLAQHSGFGVEECWEPLPVSGSNGAQVSETPIVRSTRPVSPANQRAIRQWLWLRPCG